MQGLKEQLLVIFLIKRMSYQDPQLYTEYFVLKGFKYTPLTGSTRIIKGLANCLFDDEQDKTFAFEMIENMRQPNENYPIPDGEENSNPYDNNDSEKNWLIIYHRDSKRKNYLQENVETI